MEKYFDGYNIYAHKRCVSDLPERFIDALQVSMKDKSYGNDECATFGMIHPDNDKMFHLSVFESDDERVVNEGVPRFYFNIVCLFEDAVMDGDSYLCETNYDEHEKLIATSSVEELADILADVFPSFKVVWEA